MLKDCLWFYFWTWYQVELSFCLSEGCSITIIESFDLILSAFTFNIGWMCTFLSSASQALQILHGSRSWCCDATMAYDMLLHIIFNYMWLEWLAVIRNDVFWVPNLNTSGNPNWQKICAYTRIRLYADVECVNTTSGNIERNCM